ncbi:MAG TPA: Lrp/AsnC family transcriptional regulator [Candidatus Caldiarchaeum subterraneum]|uniref:Lrp/AsnC family transcriptional regulator n=1 Tax=Caldiarchaeum subterraneum TaxID=311458 RepID=A0A833ECJ7_CALS0|nr:Lrp/AsnC family transcriptional regulator [Candidatus Caldarchaeum subterraneum]
MLERGVTVILHVFVDSNALEDVAKEITKLPEAVDVYEVTGEFDIIAVISTPTIHHFRELIKDKILRIPGVKSTVTSVVLYVHKKAGVETGE